MNAPHWQARWTVTTQLSTLPDAPQYCRWTPGVLSPFFATPVSSDPADDAHAAGRPGSGCGQVVPRDAAMQLVPHPPVVPHVVGEELLERADGAAGGQRDRLDALARQVAEQPAGVGAQVGERVARDEARPEAPQVVGERRPERGDLFVGHP